MKSIDLIGYKRTNLGKRESKRLRKEANVPCVLYGASEPVHFYMPMILFKELVFTPQVRILDMDIEGDIRRCILQDVQYHPVSDIVMHADFLELQDDKPVRIEVPVAFTGSAPGLLMGGKLAPKLRKIKVRALPGNLPDVIEVPLDGLELGKSVKIRNLKAENYEILNPPMVTIATIQIPRALRSAQRSQEK